MKKKKNILVFMTDQQNAETIYDRSAAITPNIDKFRKRAVRFDNAYTTSPHCCPSRAGFFSGLYPSQHNVWNNVEVDNTLSRGLFDGIKLFPQSLKEAGYSTIFAGKWHVSSNEGPLDRGFDKVLREYVSNYGRMEPLNKPYFHDWDEVYDDKTKIKLDDTKDFGEIIREGYPKYKQFGVEENPFGDSDTVNLVCKDIKNRELDEPFFYYVGTTGPHDPYFPPQRFLDLYKDVKIELPESFADDMIDKPALYRRTRDCFKLTEQEQKESIKRYLAFISYEDSLFGQIVDTLEEKGLFDDTYVMYLTDHGDYLANHRLWAKGLPCFEEAYRIPVLVAGPGLQKNSSCDSLVSIVDFAPTILELANIKQDFKTQGDSLVPLLKGEQPEYWRTEIFTQTNGNEIYGIQRAVWNKKWKYVLNTFDYDELYDRENDPNEMNNIINEDHEDVVKDMCKKLWKFARQTGDSFTCPYIMVSLAPYGPGIVWEDEDWDPISSLPGEKTRN
ncbi:MAG: sulfatase-like hydrolase/transferase [Spirochaetaceae bacterium]|nr:sulfatase-like hydrolase/transferase [Spirochaetaceae bacterium]